MKKAGHKPGGGIASRQRVEKPVRTGAPREGRNPRAVSQIGSSIGNHVTDRSEKAMRGVERMGNAPMPTAAGVPLGNQVALNGSGSGARPGGGGRNLYGQCGSQSTYSGQDMPTKTSNPNRSY